MTAPQQMIMQYLINTADITILADVPFVLHESNKMSPFLTAVREGTAAFPDHADLIFKLCPVETLPEVTDVRFTGSHRLYTGEGKTAGTFFVSFPGIPPYAFVSRDTLSDRILYCQYIPGNEKYMDYAHNLMTLMDIEATMLHFDALLLHASLISWKNQGIVFSAPSGTGKSTQADLWKQYEGAEILNGDRAALRKKNGVWHGYGLPYAGTSGIFRNENVPLCAIVALRQSKDNRIRKVKGAEAFKYLYPETMIHRWDAPFEQRATEVLMNILSDVPVFLLECRPDQDAVVLLRDTMNSKVNLKKESKE